MPPARVQLATAHCTSGNHDLAIIAIHYAGVSEITSVIVRCHNCRHIAVARRSREIRGRRTEHPADSEEDPQRGGGNHEHEVGGHERPVNNRPGNTTD